MNGRSGLMTFFLFFFLILLIFLQYLQMVQSDRLYNRLNELAVSLERSGGDRAFQAGGDSESEVASRQKHPGDDGDWLIWRVGIEPSTLNPIHTSSDVPTRWITSGNIFETLLEYDPDELTLRPLLAESYEVSDDGLEIIYKIRQDAEFSDGQPVTADDVVFTFDTIMNPKINAASLASYFQDVEKAVKLEERKVKFVMSRVYFKSVEMTGGMPILPKHVYEFDDPQDFNRNISNPVGSGPYVFDRWDVGRQVVLRRNNDYWGKLPNLRQMVYRFILNDTAALQALRSGQADFMRPLPEQFTELSENERFNEDFKCLSYWTPSAGYFYIAWNQDRPFFADKRVRQAMTLMLDRESICRDLLRSPDAVVPTGPFYIHGDQKNPDIEPWEYNIEKAAKLLDEAGWVDTTGDGIRDKDGIPFRFRYMIVSGTSLHDQMARLVKDQAAQLGIDVQIEPYEWSIFIERLQNRQFDATNLAWQGAVEADPYQIWHSSQIGGGGSNYVGFDHPEADSLIEKARKTMDRQERNAIYHEFHSIIHEEQPYTFVYTRPEQRFLHRRFHNVKRYELGIDPHEWYVPKELQRYD